MKLPYYILISLMICIPAAAETQIILHFRGKSGIRFNETPIKPKPLTPEVEELVKNQFRLASELVEEKILAGVDLDPCEKDESTKVKIGLLEKQHKKLLLSDTLFLYAHQLPPDPTVAFGEQVDVRVYSKDLSNPHFYSPKSFGITCIPSRVIISGEFLTIHTGAEALRNYSKNPNGKGKPVKEKHRKDKK